jgi:hypothetical protein
MFILTCFPSLNLRASVPDDFILLAFHVDREYIASDSLIVTLNFSTRAVTCNDPEGKL